MLNHVHSLPKMSRSFRKQIVPDFSLQVKQNSYVAEEGVLSLAELKRRRAEKEKMMIVGQDRRAELSTTPISQKVQSLSVLQFIDEDSVVPEEEMLPQDQTRKRKASQSDPAFSSSNPPKKTIILGKGLKDAVSKTVNQPVEELGEGVLSLAQIKARKLIKTNSTQRSMPSCQNTSPAHPMAFPS